MNQKHILGEEKYTCKSECVLETNEIKFIKLVKLKDHRSLLR